MLSTKHTRIKYPVIILLLVNLIGLGLYIKNYINSKEYKEDQSIIQDYTNQILGIYDTNTNVNQESNTVANPNNNLYEVLKVVDGDTIKVSDIGTLRLIGIDTPETVDPRKPVQCFGKEASNKAKELLGGKKVRLEYDSSQDKSDKYGRTLAYVIREDGLFFNLEMIKQGYAYEYTYSTPYKYQKEFKNAQKEAQENKRGLWGANCK